MTQISDGKLKEMMVLVKTKKIILDKIEKYLDKINALQLKMLSEEIEQDDKVLNSNVSDELKETERDEKDIDNFLNYPEEEWLEITKFKINRLRKLDTEFEEIEEIFKN